MNTDAHSIDSNNRKCIACCEPIQMGAKICPHCHSSQTPHLWHTISQGLKWIGGIVTTISLVVGVITLSRYYLDWQERHNTIIEVVQAGDWLIETENYYQAWKMYEQAAKLNPSSELVRDSRFKLAKIWVRNFKAEKKTVDKTLDDITEILYLGLPSAGTNEESSILAHIGYAQILRSNNYLPVFFDVKALLELALEKSPDNAYANAVYARWLLEQNPMTVDIIQQAESIFNTAIRYANNEKPFVRRLQILSLANYTRGRKNEIERAALSASIKACINIMQSGEDKPRLYSRNNILDSYDRFGKAIHVESLIASIPAKEHLAVYKWLLEDNPDTRLNMLRQSDYIKARLNEELGNKEIALNTYRALNNDEVKKEIQELSREAIQRLTGKAITIIIKRNYYDDPVDNTKPWGFHFETLQNFDPGIKGENLNQALDFFKSKANDRSIDNKSLLIELPKQLSRINKALLRGDEIHKMKAYTSGFNSWQHDALRNNLVSMTLLYTHILNKNKQYEKIIAQLHDTLNMIEKLDDSWHPIQGKIEFELAKAYAILADKSNNNQDKELAIEYLLNAVDHGAVEHTLIHWDEIKNSNFNILINDARYKKLIRGR